MNQSSFQKNFKNILTEKIFDPKKNLEKKTEKIFSANNEQGSLNREKKVVFRKTLKNFDLENFRSESSSCFRARVAEGRPAFRDRITVGNLESRIVYRGVGADLEKTGKYFRPPP